jgi:hypothetical protein
MTTPRRTTALPNRPLAVSGITTAVKSDRPSAIGATWSKTRRVLVDLLEHVGTQDWEQGALA